MYAASWSAARKAFINLFATFPRKVCFSFHQFNRSIVYLREYAETMHYLEEIIFANFRIFPQALRKSYSRICRFLISRMLQQSMLSQSLQVRLKALLSGYEIRNGSILLPTGSSFRMKILLLAMHSPKELRIFLPLAPLFRMRLQCKRCDSLFAAGTVEAARSGIKIFKKKKTRKMEGEILPDDSRLIAIIDGKFHFNKKHVCLMLMQNKINETI